MIKDSSAATQYRLKKWGAIALLIIFISTSFPLTASALDGGGSWANAAQQAVWKAMDVAVAKFRKQLLDTVINQIIAWINDDNGHKGPAFISDFPKVLKETADTEGMIMLQDITSKDFVAGLCQPGWALSIKATLSKAPTFGEKAQCSSALVLSNYNDFMDHFTKGGWSNWISVSESNNNPYMVYMTALDKKLTGQAEKQSEKKEDNAAGGGFLSDKVCRTMTYYASEQDAADDHLTVDNPLSYSEEDIKNLVIKDMQNQESYHDRKCVTWETRSPGKIMADAAKEGIFKDVTWLQNNSEWTSYVVAIGDALVNRLTKEGIKAIKSYDVKAGDVAGHETTPPVTSAAIIDPWHITLKSNKPGKTGFTLDGTDPAFYSKSLMEYTGRPLTLINSTKIGSKSISSVKWRSMDGDSNTEITRTLNLPSDITTPFDLTALISAKIGKRDLTIPPNIQAKLYKLVTDSSVNLDALAQSTSIPQNLIDDLKNYIAIEDYRLKQTPPTTVIPTAQLTPLRAMAANSTLYNIYWSTAPGVTKMNGTPIIGVTSPYTHIGRTNGTTYYYIATAINASGESGASNQVSATPTAPTAIAVLSAPTIIASAGNAKNVISWGDVANATSYNIYWSTTPGVTTTNSGSIIGAISPYTHKDLINGITYYYRVTAVNDSGESDASTEKSAKPATAATPSTPTITASAGDTQNIINMDTVTGATSYTISDFIKLTTIINPTSDINILAAMNTEAINIRQARADLKNLIATIKTNAASGFAGIDITDLAKTLEPFPEFKDILSEVNAIIAGRSLITLGTYTTTDAAGVKTEHDGWDTTKTYVVAAAVDSHSFVLLADKPSLIKFRVDKGGSTYLDLNNYTQKITLPDDHEYSVYANAYDAAGIQQPGGIEIKFTTPFPNAELPYLVDLVEPHAEIATIDNKDGSFTLDPSGSIDMDKPEGTQINGGITGYEWKFTDPAENPSAYDWQSFDPNRDGVFETNGCVYAESLSDSTCPNDIIVTTSAPNPLSPGHPTKTNTSIKILEGMSIVDANHGKITVKLVKSDATAGSPSEKRTIKLRVTDNEGLWTEKTTTITLP